jgi:hypothetical protein
MLLALLLSCALYGFLRVLPDETGTMVKLLYCKGALLALLLVPPLVYLLDIRVPVAVDEMVHVEAAWPRSATWALLAVWLSGGLFQLRRWARELWETRAAAGHLPQAPAALTERARHWQQRLNLYGVVALAAGGAEQPWHVGPLPGARRAVVVLPAAAVNWPASVVDVILLGQLAQLCQGGWRWLAFGRLVQALYWPMPWVGRLVEDLSAQFELPGQRLAAAAYRDPDGWQRDMRNMEKRAATLHAIPPSGSGALLRLPSSGTAWLPPHPQVGTVGLHAAVVDDLGFEQKWAHSKAHRKEKVRDPYEQAYCLIAVASILIGVATTLTQVPAAPEFEPGYLNIKWQDQMLPRLRDYAEDLDHQEDIQEHD